MGVAVDLSNQIRSTLKTFGLMAGKGAGRAFEIRVQDLIASRPTVAVIVEPLLAAWRAVRGQIGVLDRRLITLARGDATCRLLMTCPGVGVIVATSFAAAIEAPEHFRHSRSVGAYLGLTPVRRQSGEIDRTGGISRRGDRLMRSYLFEAAASLLVRVRQDSALKTWGRALAERMGFKHAAVAVARKLAVVLHAMWRAGTPFQPWPPAAA
jgi:transposase